MRGTLDRSASPSSDLVPVRSVVWNLAYSDTDTESGGGTDIGADSGTVTLPTSDTENFSGMTAEELRDAIHQQQVDLRDMDLERRKLELKYTIQSTKGDDSKIVSTVSGTVRSMQKGDEADWDLSKPLFIVDSGKGFYLNGQVNESQMQLLHVGDVIDCTCYGDTGMTSCQATVTGISDVPTESGGTSYSGDGSLEDSYYAFTAYIDQTDGLTNGMYADITLNVEGDTSALYLDSMYVRSDGVTNYVWIRDPDTGLLTKRTVTLGKKLWGSYDEIRSGLTLDDYVAVPFGKTVREGAKTKISDGTEGMGI